MRKRRERGRKASRAVIFRFGLLSLILFSGPPVFALDSLAEKLIDDYIQQKKIGDGEASLEQQKVQNSRERIDKLSTEVNALAIEANQTISEFTIMESSLDQRITTLETTAPINPYKDAEWLRSAREEIFRFCCKIKGDSEISAHIRERLGNGRSAVGHRRSKKNALRDRDDRPRGQGKGQGKGKNKDKDKKEDGGGEPRDKSAPREGRESRKGGKKGSRER